MYIVYDTSRIQYLHWFYCSMYTDIELYLHEQDIGWSCWYNVARYKLLSCTKDPNIWKQYVYRRSSARRYITLPWSHLQYTAEYRTSRQEIRLLWHRPLPRAQHNPTHLLRNDRLCVEWVIKPYTLTHSRTGPVWTMINAHSPNFNNCREAWHVIEFDIVLVATVGFWQDVGLLYLCGMFTVHADNQINTIYPGHW